MKTSDTTSGGARPLTTMSSLYYRQRPKDVMGAATRIDVNQSLSIPSSYLDSSQYEFPGDRTYQRYLDSRTGV